MLSRCLLTKISASELSRKFIKSELLVGKETTYSTCTAYPKKASNIASGLEWCSYIKVLVFSPPPFTPHLHFPLPFSSSTMAEALKGLVLADPLSSLPLLPPPMALELTGDTGGRGLQQPFSRGPSYSSNFQGHADPITDQVKFCPSSLPPKNLGSARRGRMNSVSLLGPLDGGGNFLYLL